MEELDLSIPSTAAFIRTHALVAFLIFLILLLLNNKFQRGLNSLPGPTLAAYTSLWRLLDVWKGHAHLTHIRLHEQHGPLVRIGPNHVSVSDPSAIPIIYGLKTRFYKTTFYPIQSISWKRAPRPNLFSETNPNTHRERKRLYGHTYNLSSLLEMETAIDTCTSEFLSKLRERCNSAIDLGTWLQFYAFDVVGTLVFGKKLGFLEKGRDVDGIMQMIRGMLVYASHCGQIPEAHPFLLGNPLFPVLFPAMETWNAVLTFTLKAINEAREGLNIKRDGELEVKEGLEGKKDMMSRLSRLKEEDPERYNTSDIIIHTSANVFAGSDTTAIAMRAVVYFLCRHPEKKEKLVAEIDNKYAAGKLSEPITYRESVEELPYLQAVMKESMRLHPSVGLLLERYVPPEGVTLNNHFLPGGTIVGINAWVVHRDPVIFPAPEEFRPERWLNATPQQLKVMEQTTFQFGAGSRVCLGKWMSLIEMSKVLPQLFTEFEVELAEPEKEWIVQNVWFVQQSGVICKLVPRT